MATTAAAKAGVCLLIAAAFCALPPAPARAEDPGRVIKRTLEQARAPQDQDLKRFYELRRFRPAWSQETAAAVTRVLDHAESEGLIAGAYHVDPLPTPKDKRARNSSVDGNVLAAWDMAVSRALLHYARDVRTGRVDPVKLYGEVQLPPQAFDAPTEINTALDKGAIESFVTRLPPQRPEYAYLRTALAHYRDIEARGGWSLSVRPGEPAASLSKDSRAKLAQRLAADDPEVAVDKPLADAAMTAAVRRFQARYGLEQTGRFTAETVSLLNQPASNRVLQIEANMERWRWLPREADARYIEVNTPDASLKLVANGEVLMRSPVVLGRADWPTPLLITAAKAIVVNPPWHVPPDMAGEELLPKLQRDPNYLAAQNMVVTDGPANDPHGRTIAWKDVPAEHFPYHIEQKPGPRAGLGALMIDMPNDFGVYLHDTPNKELFGRANRLLSHGCVRVRDITALASFALYGDTKQAGKIPHPARGETQRVELDQQLPVYMLYWTVFQDPDGAIAFRKDAYGLDVHLIAALYGRGEFKGAPVPKAVVADAGLPAP